MIYDLKSEISGKIEEWKTRSVCENINIILKMSSIRVPGVKETPGGLPDKYMYVPYDCRIISVPRGETPPPLLKPYIPPKNEWDKMIWGERAHWLSLTEPLDATYLDKITVPDLIFRYKTLKKQGYYLGDPRDLRRARQEREGVKVLKNQRNNISQYLSDNQRGFRKRLITVDDVFSYRDYMTNFIKWWTRGKGAMGWRARIVPSAGGYGPQYPYPVEGGVFELQKYPGTPYTFVKMQSRKKIQKIDATKGIELLYLDGEVSSDCQLRFPTRIRKYGL